jgi:hypothetical protein
MYCTVRRIPAVRNKYYSTYISLQQAFTYCYGKPIYFSLHVMMTFVAIPFLAPNMILYWVTGTPGQRIFYSNICFDQPIDLPQRILSLMLLSLLFHGTKNMSQIVSHYGDELFQSLNFSSYDMIQVNTTVSDRCSVFRCGIDESVCKFASLKSRIDLPIWVSSILFILSFQYITFRFIHLNLA